MTTLRSWKILSPHRAIISMISATSFSSMMLLSSSLILVSSSAFLLNPTTTSVSSFQVLVPSLPNRNNHRYPLPESFKRPTASNKSNNGNIRSTNNEEGSILRTGMRNRLHRLTGFSTSAIRASLRASTGFSLTAARLALRGFTGGIVTKTMKQFTAIFPSSIRYFMQPFLILYFTPIMILKGLCDRPKQMEALASHEKLVKGWKNAVRRAELVQDGNYWPVHVNGTS